MSSAIYKDALKHAIDRANKRKALGIWDKTHDEYRYDENTRITYSDRNLTALVNELILKHEEDERRINDLQNQVNILKAKLGIK